LDDTTLPNEAYLGIGALAGKYASEHLTDGVPQFEGLINKLAAPLAKTNPTNRADENRVRIFIYPTRLQIFRYVK